MNLIALPHTNPFVQIFNIGKAVKVGEDFDELLHEAPFECRAVALLLREASQEEAAVKAGTSRHEIQRMAAMLRKKEPIATIAATHKCADLEWFYEASRDTAEMLDMMEKAGLVLRDGKPYTLRYLYSWLSQNNLKPKKFVLESHRIIFEMKEAGSSYRQIADELGRRGIMTNKGIPWSRKLVNATYFRLVNKKGPSDNNAI